MTVKTFERNIIHDQLRTALDASDQILPIHKKQDINERYNAHMERGKKLAEAREQSNWDKADWYLDGDEFAVMPEFGHYYDDAISIWGGSYDTFARMVSVARAFPPEERDYAVHFEKHKEITKYEPHIRRKLLKRIKDRKWTVSELRQFKRRFDALLKINPDSNVEDVDNLKTQNKAYSGAPNEVKQKLLQWLEEQTDNLSFVIVNISVTN